MPRKARLQSASGIYHIMLRGANKQEIFHDEGDCKYFLTKLKKCKDVSGMSVYGWCLMNNHVHLLLKEGEETISTTMKRLGVAYVYYYNCKYETIGHLFQDRFKSETVESIRYLLTVVRYIHQNPLKAGIVSRIGDWKWSSYLGYLGEVIYPVDLLNCEYVLTYFSKDRADARSRFKEFNQKNNKDECLDDHYVKRKRFTDEEARKEIVKILGSLEIAQVKSLPRTERTIILRKIKGVEEISQRQASRILGISPNLIFRA